jgi:hypothetical protein
MINVFLGKDEVAKIEVKSGFGQGHLNVAAINALSAPAEGWFCSVSVLEGPFLL